MLPLHLVYISSSVWFKSPSAFLLLGLLSLNYSPQDNLRWSHLKFLSLLISPQRAFSQQSHVYGLQRLGWGCLWGHHSAQYRYCSPLIPPKIQFPSLEDSLPLSSVLLDSIGFCSKELLTRPRHLLIPISGSMFLWKFRLPTTFESLSPLHLCEGIYLILPHAKMAVPVRTALDVLPQVKDCERQWLRSRTESHTRCLPVMYPWAGYSRSSHDRFFLFCFLFWE